MFVLFAFSAVNRCTDWPREKSFNRKERRERSDVILDNRAEYDCSFIRFQLQEGFKNIVIRSGRLSQSPLHLIGRRHVSLCSLRSLRLIGARIGHERNHSTAKNAENAETRERVKFQCGRKTALRPRVISHFVLIQVNTVAASLFEKAVLSKLSKCSLSTRPKSRSTPTLTTRPANSFTGRNSSIN
jgi:hypothetical protein